MNKILKNSLILILCLYTISAWPYTNKTFFSSRHILTNKAMELTTWHKHINKKSTRIFDGSMQATIFYEESHSGKNLGKYFGHFSDTCNKEVANIYVETNKTETSGMFNNHIFHNAKRNNNDEKNEMTQIWNDSRRKKSSEIKESEDRIKASPFGGCLSFRPRIERWGIRFDWFQNLDFILNGLYFKISTAIVDSNHNLKACLHSCTDDCTSLSQDDNLNCKACNKTTCCNGGTALADTEITLEPNKNEIVPPSVVVVYGSLTGKKIDSYFNGTLMQPDGPNKQAALDAVHISGTGCNSQTELADIEIVLGYTILNRKNSYFGWSIGLLIPTSSSPNGSKLFEAVSGSKNHWAFDTGLHAKYGLLQNGKYTLELLLNADYRFYFSDIERRTLGIRNRNESGSKAFQNGHYYLGGQKGIKGTFPLANVLTRKVDVEAKSQFNGAIILSSNWQNCTLDIGYELYARSGENIKEKSWLNNTYSIADFGYDGEKNFEIANDGFDSDQDGTGDSINRTDLIRSVAQTPSQLSHKLFSGLGYSFTECHYPLMLSIASSYEFKINNATLDMWAIWGKIGISF